jgi:hypothetical protein
MKLHMASFFIKVAGKDSKREEGRVNMDAILKIFRILETIKKH